MKVGKQTRMQEHLVWAQAGRPERSRLAELVERALGGLNEHMRLSVSLHYEHGFTYGEAAEILELPEATLRKYAQRGLEVIRERLSRAGYAVAPGAIVEVLSSGLGVWSIRSAP